MTDTCPPVHVYTPPNHWHCTCPLTGSWLWHWHRNTGKGSRSKTHVQMVMGARRMAALGRCQIIRILCFARRTIPGGWTFVHLPTPTALSTCDTGGRPPTPHYMDPASWPITCEWTNLTMCSREIIRPVFHPY